MSDRTPENKDTPPEALQNDAIDQSRRKLTGAALGVSAIFTLASRPVLAGQCMTPSAAASGNLSTHGTPPQCTGNSPDTWVSLAQQKNSNPNIPNNGFPNGNVKFHDVFVNGSRASWGGSTRLYEVMAAGDNGNTGDKPNPISKEFAAALLNIRGGYVPAVVLTETQLLVMWNDWMASGTFDPKAGATWDANLIVTYLRTLQA